MRTRALLARPALLVLLTIMVLAGSAAILGWGGDRLYTTWPYGPSRGGTVTRVDSRYDVDVELAGPPAGRISDVEFGTPPSVGETVAVRCATDDGEQICIDDDLYRGYRRSEERDAILPLLGLAGILLLLISCAFSIRRWARVYRRDRVEGRRELRVGVLTFATGMVVTVGWFYLALLRVTR